VDGVTSSEALRWRPTTPQSTTGWALVIKFFRGDRRARGEV